MADVHPLDKRCMPLNCDGCETSATSGLLAVTMYELLPDSTRIGQVQMYGIGSREGSHHLIDLCKIDCPGVFDLRWRPCQSHQAGVNTEPVDRQADPSNSGSRQDLIREGGDMAALALADGSCQLVEIRDVGITAVATQPNAACGGMSLSCDWSTFATTDLFCSSSNGMISQCRVAESALVQTQEWQAHEMEAWMVTCDLHQCSLIVSVCLPDLVWVRLMVTGTVGSRLLQEHVVYSGDDSCSFKGWDTRASAEQMFCNRRGHGAGVCCIQSHPMREFQVATGCYDEHVRLWDLRNATIPVMSQKVGLGGGVWRMKWHPEQAEVALIACMQNGFAVVALGDCPTVYSYPHQKVLGYGADWVCSGGNWLAATCSFYDKSLHLWQYDPARLLETGDSSAV